MVLSKIVIYITHGKILAGENIDEFDDSSAISQDFPHQLTNMANLYLVYLLTVIFANNFHLSIIFPRMVSWSTHRQTDNVPWGLVPSQY